MSELRWVLERVGERVTPRPDAFERLVRARQRRERNRRVAAGILALVVAAAGLAGLVVAFSVGQRTVVGGEREEPSPVVPIVGTIRCGETPAEVRVVTPRVQPAEDGVHLTISSGSARDVQILDPERFLEWRISLGAGEVRRVVLADLPPGTYRVSCLPAPPERSAPIRVVDPDRLWRPLELDCPDEVQRIEFGHGAVSGPADPADAVRTIPGVERSDALEYAGYPLASDAVRVVRRGEVIGLVRLARADRGGWVVSSVESCPGSGLLATPG